MGMYICGKEKGNRYFFAKNSKMELDKQFNCRWLSAPYNNPTCPDECRPTTSICAEPPTCIFFVSYFVVLLLIFFENILDIKGHGYSYWVPLEFTSSGDIAQFAPFVNNFTLNLIY